MKTLKKVATVLAVLLGLGFVLSTTSCGIANVIIDEDFIANEDFSSFVWTWVITIEEKKANGVSDNESEEVEFISAEVAKAYVQSIYTQSEVLKKYADSSIGGSYEYSLATNLSRTVIVWKQKAADYESTVTMKKK